MPTCCGRSPPATSRRRRPPASGRSTTPRASPSASSRAASERPAAAPVRGLTALTYHRYSRFIMHLTDRQVADFRRDGCVFPIRVLSAAEAGGYRARLEAYEAATGAPIQGNLRHKTHLLFTWADELVHHPAILDAVADVIGPDILCWTTNFFIKEPSSAGFVSWHQDSTYWGLDPADVVTAWVAFTDATPENGYMQFIPGTHT